MTMPSPQRTTIPLWQVTSQTPAQRPGAAGKLESGYVVMFTTKSGVPGEVFVPDSVYSPETVRRMIAAKVPAIERVQALKSES